jgi:hypothetical protein
VTVFIALGLYEFFTILERKGLHILIFRHRMGPDPSLDHVPFRAHQDLGAALMCWPCSS